MTKKKSCKKGYYYCNTDEKCKKIPKGYHLMPTGYLMKDSDHKEDEKSDDTEGKKKNGNGNGSNGNGNGNGGSNGGSNGGGVSEAWSAKYKKSIDCDNPKGFSQKAHCRGRKIDEGKDGMSDHEVSMAKGQVRNSITNLKRVEKVLKTMTDKDDLPAWLQAKITDTEHNTDAAAGYMDEEVITEKRDGKSSKDKGYSLRDWFKGGGWKQTGGKYDGKPCAKQPGQKTKPYCRDADDRAAMSKEERNKRAAKKRKEDPNPNRKGKAKNVTQEFYSNWRSDLEQLDEFFGLFGPKTVTPKDSPSGTKSVTVGKKYPARQNRRPVDVTYDKDGNKTVTPMSRARAGLMQYKYGSTWGMPQYNSYQPEGEVVEGFTDGDGDIIRPHHKILRKNKQTLSDDDIKRMKEKGIPLDKAHYEPQGELVDEGKKDACYHKVKSRYSVWPSAYASGALVKCRKVGAKNWGNKTKKEEYIPEFASKATVERIKREGGKVPSFGTGGMTAPNNGGLKGGNEHLRKGNKTNKEGYEFSNWRDDFIPTEYETTDLIKADPIQVPPSNLQKIEEAKKCWKGYKKTGTQKLFGKTYNRCEKIKKEHYDWRAEINIQEAIPGYEKYNAAVKAANKLTGRDKINALKAAAALRPPTEKEVNQKLGEDWQKSNRKDGVDGMSQKSVDAYRRENPGSKLKTAVTGKVKKGSKDAKRRKSFCSRSDGQRKMHNIDCKKTPDKKICKARRRWKC